MDPLGNMYIAAQPNKDKQKVIFSAVDSAGITK